MGRPRRQPVAAPEPENESQEQPDDGEERFLSPEESIRQAEANGDMPPQPSKADAVRQALAEGLAKPGDIVDFVKGRFGIDMPKQMASSYKAQAKAREAKAGGDYQPRQRTAPAQQFGIPNDFGQDVRAIKDLIEKVGGAEELKDLAGSISTLEKKYGVSGFNSLVDAFG